MSTQLADSSTMDTTHTQTPPTGPPHISDLVIQAIAKAEECDPSMVTPPLYDAIDPDALDAIYARASPCMHFEYSDYQIEITPARIVTVQPQ